MIPVGVDERRLRRLLDGGGRLDELLRRAPPRSPRTRRAAPPRSRGSRAGSRAPPARAPRGAPPSRRHCSTSPAASVAPSSTSSVGAARRRKAGRAAPAGAYSSSATWKLLPPKPKLDTDGAPRVRAVADPRPRAACSGRTGCVSISSFGLGRSTLIVGGSTLWCSASTALISPAAPAAALVCPICDFTEPSAHHCGSLAARLARTPSCSPSNSAASPAFVPVPCASTSSTVSGP